MDDFNQRLSAKASCLGIQPSHLIPLFSVLQESVRSVQQGGANSNNQQSQLTAVQPQLSQPSVFAGSQFSAIGNDIVVDDQFMAQMLSDPTLGISQTGCWNTL